MKSWSIISALLFASACAFAMWRNVECGYDCGILPGIRGGSGPAVVVVAVLSAAGFVVSLITFVVSFFINSAGSRRPDWSLTQADVSARLNSDIG